MLYSAFKDQTVSYLNRSAASIVTDAASDLVLVAMNDARRWAQREYNFSMLEQQVFVELSMLQKSMLTDFKATPSGTTVVVKRIDSMWEYGTTTVGATTVYYPTKEIRIRRRASLKKLVPFDPNDTALSNPTQADFVYVQGTNIAHTNLTTPTWVMADAVVMLGEHAGGAVEDIFLTYHIDWLRWMTLANLNVWLKDSERTPIDANLLARSWDGVKQFDAQQAVSTDDLSLD